MAYVVTKSDIIAENDDIAFLNIHYSIHFWDKSKLQTETVKTPYRYGNTIHLMPKSDYWLIYCGLIIPSLNDTTSLKLYKGANMIFDLESSPILGYYKKSSYNGNIIGFYVLHDRYLVLIIEGYNDELYLYTAEFNGNTPKQKPVNPQVIPKLEMHTGNKLYGSNTKILNCSNENEIFLINSFNIYKFWFEPGSSTIMRSKTRFDNFAFDLYPNVYLDIKFVNGQIYLYKRENNSPWYDDFKDYDEDIKTTRKFAIHDYDILFAIIDPETMNISTAFNKPVDGSYYFYLSPNLVLGIDKNTSTQYLGIVQDNPLEPKATVIEKINLHCFEPNSRDDELYFQSFVEDERYIVIILKMTSNRKIPLIQIDKISKTLTYFNYKSDPSYSATYIGDGRIITFGQEFQYINKGNPAKILIKNTFNINSIDIPKKVPLPFSICNLISDFLQIKTINY